MPENSSGFIDFNRYSELNADSERQLLEQALQRAEEATAKEKQALRKSEVEASNAVTGLSSTLSYSDYLKASRDAASAWAAVTSRSKDPRLAALQGSIGGEAGARAAAERTNSAQRQAAIGGRLEQSRGDAIKANAAREAYEKKQADEKKASADSFEEARQAYIQSMVKNAKGRAGAGGAQRDFVGMYNPYASSGWAQQQGGWESQQLKNAGGTDAQMRGVWDAYTGKGSQGSSGAMGRSPQERYQPMYREMQPFRTEEED